MRWYKLALRKHLMRFDPRVVVEASADDPNLKSILTSFISSAIIKGLDIVGMVNVNPSVPIEAVRLAKQQGVDVYVIPGQIYKTSDDFDVIIYNSDRPYEANLTLEALLTLAKNNNHLTLVYDLGKQKASRLFNLGEKGIKPTFVEIFSSKSYGYLYLKTNTYEVVSSAASTPLEMEQTNIYSQVPRKDMENMHIIPRDFGANYSPPYLEPHQEAIA